MADADQFRKVAAIVEAEPERRYVVASAPGKRFSGDTKVTDMLYESDSLDDAYFANTSEISKNLVDFIRLTYDFLGILRGRPVPRPLGKKAMIWNIK